MTRWYWRRVNKRQGLLIEEFHAVKRDGNKGNNKRHIDGVIVLGRAGKTKQGDILARAKQLPPELLLGVLLVEH